MPQPSLREPAVRRRSLAAFLAGACMLAAGPSSGQTADNVLVVANGRLPVSVALASHYAARRAVPPDQVIRVDVEATDEIDSPASSEASSLPCRRGSGPTAPRTASSTSS